MQMEGDELSYFGTWRGEERREACSCLKSVKSKDGVRLTEVKKRLKEYWEELGSIGDEEIQVVECMNLEDGLGEDREVKWEEVFKCSRRIRAAGSDGVSVLNITIWWGEIGAVIIVYV